MHVRRSMLIVLRSCSPTAVESHLYAHRVQVPGSCLRPEGPRLKPRRVAVCASVQGTVARRARLPRAPPHVPGALPWLMDEVD